MRFLLAVALVVVLAPNVWADLTASVYLADDKTPLLPVDPNVPNVYRDVMVGTRLAVFIESDAADYRGLALSVPWDDEPNGLLAARGEDDGVYRYLGFRDSCLEAAGGLPTIQARSMFAGNGFEMYSDLDATAGRWFVIDYHAEAVGSCHLLLYDYFSDFDGPVQILSFTHVPSRDFDGDTIVNLADFARLASQWGQVAVVDPNLNGSPDLNADGVVDTLDVALFSEYWLARTDFVEPNEPVTDPNALPTEPCPPTGPAKSAQKPRPSVQ